MHRFYIEGLVFSGDNIIINNKEEIHHLKHVLRLKRDDEIYIFNGKGEEAKAIIVEIKNLAVVIKIESIMRKEVCAKPEIILACAIPKKTKFEYIIEKCTELGIDEIIPMVTKRTEFHLTKEKRDKKVLRYHSVAVNATKQSNRLKVPIIHPITVFNDVILEYVSKCVSYIPCLEGSRSYLLDIIKINKIAVKDKYLFIVGPEGDFTSDEVSCALKAGCVPVTLGDTVLKVDTAAISVIAVMKALIASKFEKDNK